MAFPLKNHLKLGFRDESLDTSQGNTRLWPAVASKLKGDTIILVGSSVLEEKKKSRLLPYERHLQLYEIQPHDGGNKV